jgi:hypothetical protein
MTETTADKTYGRLITFEEMAEWLPFSIHTLRKKAQNGEFETHKLWGRRLVYEDEVIRLIEESRVQARGEKRPRVESVTAPTRGRGRR